MNNAWRILKSNQITLRCLFTNFFLQFFLVPDQISSSQNLLTWKVNVRSESRLLLPVKQMTRFGIRMAVDSGSCFRILQDILFNYQIKLPRPCSNIFSHELWIPWILISKFIYVFQAQSVSCHFSNYRLHELLQN